MQICGADSVLLQHELHAVMGRFKAQVFIELAGLLALQVGCELDQKAAPFTADTNGLLHHLSAVYQPLFLLRCLHTDEIVPIGYSISSSLYPQQLLVHMDFKKFELRPKQCQQQWQ